MAIELPTTGFVREKQIVGDRKKGITGVLPISRSAWWEGVRSGRYPAPVRGLGARITCWRVEDIRALIERVGVAA